MRCLGRGGYGEVHLARQSGTDALVAVKVLREDLGKPTQALKRLKDEARLLALLDHPVILEIIELTRIDGRIALVTEYIEGVDVHRFTTPSTRLPTRAVLEVIAAVSDALSCAHDTPSPETGKPLRLVHRDLKPENIRVSTRGQVKLLDFGIARSDEVEREAHTKTGHMAFTPGYVAPESYITRSQAPATDVFGLAATMYRLLAGAKLFAGLKLGQQVTMAGSVTQFERFVRRRVDRLDRAPPSVKELLCDCLAWDPAQRPTAAEVHRRAVALVEELPGGSLAETIAEGSAAAAHARASPPAPGSLAPTVIAPVPTATPDKARWGPITIAGFVAVLVGLVTGVTFALVFFVGLWAAM